MVKSTIEMTESGKIEKNIHISDANEIISKFSKRFQIDLLDMMLKVSKGVMHGFSINHNNPYMHLYIGYGLRDVSFEVMMKDKTIKLRIDDDELEKWCESKK